MIKQIHLNKYGLTKYLSEKHVVENANFGYIIRTSWLYSKNYGHNFYRNILRKASNGEEIKVVKDQYGTPTNTETVADFIIKIIISLPKKGIYHCAGDEVMSWYDFANKIVMENKYTQIKLYPYHLSMALLNDHYTAPLKNSKL